MVDQLGKIISKSWWLIILFWIALVAVSKTFAPAWDDVTNDGDLAYMPDEMTSVVGERLLEQAFPDGRSKSEMVIIVSRPDQTLTEADQAIVDSLAARIYNMVGVSAYLKAEKFLQNAADLRVEEKHDEAEEVYVKGLDEQKKAVDALNVAIEFDREFGLAWHNLSQHFRKAGDVKKADEYGLLARDFDSNLNNADAQKQMLPLTATDLPIIDIWSYLTPTFGEKLKSKDKKAQLLVVRLSQEFMATDNMRIFEQIQDTISEVREKSDFPDGLKIGLTGSASIGADMLLSSAESIKNTELYTVILVVTILILVYRSPLLVVVPLITIVCSLMVATGLVASLTCLHVIPGFDWWNFKIFTTTKIFVVVILFGAGTDYCLFLISRFKEELLPDGSNGEAAVATAVSGVSDALIGSAFTTIIGLAMMFFADFGKFRNSGPAIGLCLAVTLFACLTLAPALLRALGRSIFWPFPVPSEADQKSMENNDAHFIGRVWSSLAKGIVTYPGRILVLCTVALIPFAYLGTGVEVTYNFLSELDPQRLSKTGTRAMREHFPVGETGPLIVLAKTDAQDLDSTEGKKALLSLTKDLYVDGVLSVRSLSSPEGDPRSSYRDLLIKSHEFIRSLYVSKLPSLNGDVARFELVLKYEPFSLEAINVLNQVESLVNKKSEAAGYWRDTQFVFSGTTAAIRDLRTVTRADNIKIQFLVALGVLAVLLVLLRRPFICVYLILSVLFSYYATLGATELFFKYAYGETFEGLDWKVPLFLFVILVAIGQDYNIYLATRVFEEQERHGLFGGLRRAIVRTGGIITSCGVIMAGTFISMTTGSLRGIVELGFALSLGVMLDTFVVRPILVPAFLAILFRHTAGDSSIGGWFKLRRHMTTTTAHAK